MKQILLLAIIHLLIYHQCQKDKKQQKFFTSGKTAVAVKKEQKRNNLNTLLYDLQINRSDSSFFLYATGLVGYNFTDYSFPLKKQGVNLVWISPK